MADFLKSILSAHLSDLTLCREEDPREGIRQTCAIGSKQAASLVHVDPQLEDLLHCGRIKTLNINHITILDPFQVQRFAKMILELS